MQSFVVELVLHFPLAGDWASHDVGKALSWTPSTDAKCLSSSALLNSNVRGRNLPRHYRLQGPKYLYHVEISLMYS